MKERCERALKKIFTLAAVFAAMTAIAAAGAQRRDSEAPLSIADFAFRHSIGANDEGRVYRIHVTNEIFRGLRRSYETDLAVFDSDANPVPFIVRDVRTPYRAHDEPPPSDPVKTTAPLFPLPPAGGSPASMAGVTIKTGEDGQVVEIVGGSGTPGTGRFLADLSKIGTPRDGRPVTGYDIEIPAGGEKDAEAYADVYLSDNLRDWTQAARREPLIRLRRGSDVVASGVIRLDSRSPARYLMLEVDGEWELPDSIVVSIRAGEREDEIRQDSASFGGVPGDAPRSVIYDTAGAFPASEVNFILEIAGVYAASVSSRNDADGEWRRQGDVRLSLIKNDAGESRNAPISVFRTNDRFWKLTMRDNLPSPPPVLQMRWHPKELVFVAQGKPPYVLAFGRGGNPPRLARPDLMQIALGGIDERDILEAEIGASAPPVSPDRPPDSESGGTDAYKEWTKYAVWAVLVGGALLLSWIAWSLIRKNKTEE
jgi:hypothetical protein